jgi:uncharacterized protein YcbK (DUF882 family)
MVKVHRGARSLGVVLYALLFVSAAADARRPLSGTTTVADDDLDTPRHSDEVCGDRGVPISLGSAEQGRSFIGLPALRVTNARGVEVLVRLYEADGQLDGDAQRALDDVLADARDPANVHTTAIDHRTLQLLFRAAYHFGAPAVQVVSGYRQPGRRSEGNHAEGKALDFRLSGVSAATLASYLRTLPRVGVGVYTHRRTQFVHLDVRERSFYWLDASPPGRTWRERPIGSGSTALRDAGYRGAEDWPEGTRAPRMSAGPE